ncbi:MAG: leucyl aminopeptidase [Dehalococcoidia bacterium]|nr:leucyl aminopeptidase [Dehalococcoidia bacterium]
MKLRAVQGDIMQQPVDAILVNVFEGAASPGGAAGAADKALHGAITSLIADGEIRGKRGEATVIHTLGSLPAKRVIVAGLGKQASFTADTVRAVSGDVARTLKRLRVGLAATVVHEAGAGGIEAEQAAQALAEGTLLGAYEFSRHKSKEEPAKALELLVVERDSKQLAAVERGLKTGAVIAEAVALCRDLANEPANHMTPTVLADTAQRIAKEHGLEITVLERPQCQELGMGSYLSVAQGSAQPPKFIVVRYWGDRANPENAIGLVGKGITFDSGGISIKPAEGMEQMKGDMAGGAAVLGAIQAVARLGVRLNVTAIVPATENMPGGSASRPGDVVRAMNGKSIEIVNTDAEGRLVLADGICYAKHLGLKRVVDVATLTGAMGVALGSVRMGVFGNHQELMDRIKAAGDATGELMWQMPMDEAYKEQLRSEVADIKNVGGRAAGSITGALFMDYFAEGVQWAHLDIASVARTDKVSGHLVKGHTGIPVRALVRLCQELAQRQ